MTWNQQGSIFDSFENNCYRCEYPEVTFTNKGEKFRSIYTFNHVASEGWVNVPIYLGLLENIHEEDNRVVFEFNLNSTKFCAWSVTHRKANSQLLKKGKAYIVEGVLRVDLFDEEFFRSYHTDSRFTLLLSEIIINDEIIPSPPPPLQDEISFQSLSEKINSETPFTRDLKNVTIIDGHVYKYWGCEICTKALHARDLQRDGVYYYCSLCQESRQGKNCLIIRELQLQDSIGGGLEDIVCFEKCVKLIFGEAELKRICSTSNDLAAGSALEKVRGAVVNCTLRNARVVNAHPNIYWPRTNLILAKVEVIQLPPSTNDAAGDRDNSQQIPTISSTSPNDYSEFWCACDGDSSDDDSNEDEENNPNSISNYDSNIITKTRTENFYNSYRLADKLGLCLIVNINEFTSRPDRTRNGSEEDVKALVKLFLNLNYDIYGPHKDLNKEGFETVLKEFKEELKAKNYSSAVVIFMSHGAMNYGKLVDDTETLNIWEDIMWKFSLKNFPEFHDKSKIFIYQICQNVTPQSSQLGADDQDLLANTIYIVPTQPGVTAKRNTRTGSYFIQGLVRVIEKYHKYEDLKALFDRVQGEFREKIGRGHKVYNVPFYSPILFSHKFYFWASPAPS